MSFVFVGQAEEILFAAGEALSFLWGGVPVTADMILKTNYTSLSTDSNFLMREVKSLSKKLSDAKTGDEDSRVTTRETISGKLFDTLLYSSRKDERCAGTVWMLSLIMYCGQHPSIQLMLPKIQVSKRQLNLLFVVATLFSYCTHGHLLTSPVPSQPKRKSRPCHSNLFRCITHLDTGIVMPITILT